MFRKWNDIIQTYIEGPKKKLGNISNIKFFTADPYFVEMF